MPGVRTSLLKQINFATRSRSPALAPGMSFDCLPSFSGRRCLRPALSHLLSPGIPNLLATVNRRRCNTIERHHSSPAVRIQQACRIREKAYPVCAAQHRGPDTDRLAGNCQLLHGRGTDRERRKVRHQRFDRRSSYVAIWYPVASDKRRDWAVRDSSDQ